MLFDEMSIVSVVAISENSWVLFSKSSPRGVKEILLSVRKSQPKIKLYDRTLFSKI